MRVVLYRLSIFVSATLYGIEAGQREMGIMVRSQGSESSKAIQQNSLHVYGVVCSSSPKLVALEFLEIIRKAGKHPGDAIS